MEDFYTPIYDNISLHCALIERPDGTTYVQQYMDFEDLLELKRILGDDYLIVSCY